MLRIATILISCSVALLIAIGMVMLASTSFWVASPENPLSLFNKQVGILTAALASGFLLMLLSPSQIRALAMPLFILGLLCLIACYIPGIRVNRGGAFRWIDLPLLPQFQPSEIGKITTLIGLAAFFASHTAEIGRFFRGFVLPSLIVCVPVMLIFFEEDMDTALALGFVCMLTMWCIGTKIRFIIPSAMIAI
jgi:cell division protein FtsW